MTHSAPPETADSILRLPDGRGLGYAEYGAADGMPVLFFHGAPGSRRSLFADMAVEAAQRGLRVIVPERPGYGLSDPFNGRTVAAWTSDIRAFTSALGIGRYKLIGFSMGSLYALACAQALPAQVERVAIVSGLAPLSVAGVDAGRSPALRAFYALAGSDPLGLRAAMAPLADSPAGLVELMSSSAAAVDQALFATRGPGFMADYTEALRGGIEGIARDVELAAGAWTFPLAETMAQTDLWIGSEDCSTPPAMTRHLAAVLPHSRIVELPGAGHFCLYSHWHAILDQLLA